MPAVLRTGLPGLLFSLLTVLVACVLSNLLHRWFARRSEFFVRHRRVLLGTVYGLVALGPLGRWLVAAGLTDRLNWIEAVGQLFSLTLLMAVPALYLRDFVLDKTLGPKREEPSVDTERRELLVGGAFVGVSLAPLLWGVKSRFDAEIVEIPVRLAKLPKALDGLSIVQVSDIHIGAFLGEAQLLDAERMVAALRPDLVVMTGDLVHLRPSYLPLGVDWVRRLGERARYGALSILGNHEYYTGRAAVLDAFDRAKLELLINRGKRIEKGLVIGGVDDLWSAAKGFPAPDAAAAFADATPDDARVLLAHQPTFHPFAATHGVDLQLSGHTHGGQIAPYGPMVARALFGPYRGLHRIGASNLYVNRGFGTSGPPVRVAVRPEITKIILVAG